MTRFTIDLNAREVEILRALAFLDEDSGKGRCFRALRGVIDRALSSAEFDPAVREAMRAKRKHLMRGDSAS